MSQEQINKLNESAKTAADRQEEIDFAKTIVGTMCFGFMLTDPLRKYHDGMRAMTIVAKETKVVNSKLGAKLNDDLRNFLVKIVEDYDRDVKGMTDA